MSWFRSALLALCVAVALSPASTLAAKAEKPAAAAVPPAFKDFKSPLSEARTQELAEQAKKDKPKIPHFKRGATAEQRTKTIASLDRTMGRIKAAKKPADAAVRDGIRVWESMSTAQKQEVLAEPSTANGFVPGIAAVEATAAAVVAVVAVARFAYKVYQDQEAEEAKEDKGGDDKGGDTGGEDADEVARALSY